MHTTRFVLVLAAIILVMHAMLISTIHDTYRVPSRSITFLEWVGAQNAIAADAAATADLRLAARFERVEHDLMIRLVEGTASAADKLLVPALVARDQILGPITAWCPWWWRSASYIPELRTHLNGNQHGGRPGQVAPLWRNMTCVTQRSTKLYNRPMPSLLPRRNTCHFHRWTART